MIMSQDEQPASGYLETISALRRFTQQKAGELAHDLLAQAGLDDFAVDAQQRIGRLTDEIVIASRANREMLQHLIRGEVDKAMGRLRFARAEELSDLRAEVDELQARLDQLEAEQNGAGWAVPDEGVTVAPEPSLDEPLLDEPTLSQPLPGTEPTSVRRPVKKTPAKKTPAKNTPAKKTPAKKAPAKTTTAKKSTARKSTVEKTATKNSATRKSATSKTAAASRAGS